MGPAANVSPGRRLDVPLVGFGISDIPPEVSLGSATEEAIEVNGRVGRNVGRTGLDGHDAPRPDRDSIMIDAGWEADMRGESGSTSQSHIAANDRPLPCARTVRFDAHVGADLGVEASGVLRGTEVNGEGSPAKRRRVIRFADEV